MSWRGACHHARSQLGRVWRCRIVMRCTNSPFDVVSGRNGTCGGSYLYTAGVEGDGSTGLGTSNGTAGFYVQGLAYGQQAVQPGDVITGKTYTQVITCWRLGPTMGVSVAPAGGCARVECNGR